VQTALPSDAQSQFREFARTLHHARTQGHMSVDTASRECQLSDMQILGLEAADLRPFYSPAYALRGAERYARYLGVGPVPQACIAELGADMNDDAERATIERGPRPSRWSLRLKRLMNPLKPCSPPPLEPGL